MRETEALLERAEASIRAARELSTQGFHDFAASRAYYAAFYAATALLLEDGLEFRKHSGVIAAIHREYVRTGRLDKKYGKDLNWLFELRNIGDYGVIDHVSQKEAEKAIEVASGFLLAVRTLLQGGTVKDG
ncbi:MAG TPA: HEPN domain-containing protein [Thermoflexia bacterium]|jgi:uncharacterized protein (UPF0332 family)|nr:HEPN domain-containing protein [Thermoflexia bacterium]